VYVDMTTLPAWDGPVLRAVDLDLDVVRGRDGDVMVDDEDELAEHRVVFGYPPEIVALAEASRDRVRAAILAEEPPYDGRHEHWLAVLASL
jgi:protein associated with RNAse G/E